MKKIIDILLISFLGFLGCSDGNDGTSTFNGQALPVAPFGIVETPTPSYEWTPVPGATKYRLLVQDTSEAANTTDKNEKTVIEEWYTAEEAGCASEESLCMVTPEIEVIGEHVFMVQACSDHNCGQWSEEITFDITNERPMPRFIDHGDGTVTDRKTHLMWEKKPLNSEVTWKNAFKGCEHCYTSNYADWFLPHLRQLKSLVDKKERTPALPSGHPFTDVKHSGYWTRTVVQEYPDQYSWC